MAQEKYGFFQGTAEDPRSYDSGDMAEAFGTLASGGVADTGANLQVTAGGNMNTNLGYGTAMIQGHYYKLRDDGGGAKVFTHTTEASLNRIDRIILRLDLTARTVAAVKLIGTAGASPAPPALTRTSEIYELSLAQVLIQAGVSEIQASDITDEREDDGVCGLIAPESLRKSTVEQMIEDGIDAGNVLRYAAQSLETAEKTQARTNLDAQQKITANGMLKANGSGGVSAASAETDYALPVTEVSATLSAALWSGSSAPFTQNIVVSGMTAAKKGVSAGLSNAATDEEFEVALAAVLHASAQGTNYVTIKAHGEKPAVNLPVLVQIKG